MIRSFRSSPAFPALLLYVLGCMLFASAPAAASNGSAPGGEKRALEFVDLMKFLTIEGATIAENGSWVAYELVPDRGDGAVEIRSADGERTHRIERGAGPALTPDGRFAAAKVRPSFAESEKAKESGSKKGEGDDGPTDGLALVDTTSGEVVTFERVEAFAFSGDGRWLAVHHLADLEDPPESEESSEESNEGAATETEPVETTPIRETEAEPTGETAPGEEPAAEVASEPTSEPEAETESEDEDDEAERQGTTLRLRRLADGAEITIEHVEHFAFDATGAWLALAHARPDGRNALVVRDLSADSEGENAGESDSVAPEIPVAAAERARYTAITWTEDEDRTGEAVPPALAFVAAVDAPSEEVEDEGDDEGKDEAPKKAAKKADSKAGEPGDGEIWLWDAATREGGVLIAADWPSAPEGDEEAWHIPSKNEIRFSPDGQRLFFGTRPRPEDASMEGDDADHAEGAAEGADEAADPYDVESILDDATVDVWHVDDPLIKTNERQQWEETEKDRTFLAVHHRRSEKTVQLADREVRDIDLRAGSAEAMLAFADIPYLRERTWDGFYVDLYRVRLEDGEKELVARRTNDPRAVLSPDGRRIVFWHDGAWHLYDTEDRSVVDLTGDLDVAFADERHDYPFPVPGYEEPTWLADSSAVLLHDRFDLWSFPVGAGSDRTAAEPVRLTEGRADQTVFRVVDLDRDQPWLEPGARLLLKGYSDREKNDGFWEITDWSASGPSPEVRKILEEPKRVDVLAQTEDADTILYTRESYREFPDLWVANPSFEGRRKLSNANPQIDDYAWGHAELVDFTSGDGAPLQGVLIRPESLTDEALAAGERCPVLVYYYRYFSQRLHEFNQPVVNHRPSFPVYASHGYCVFLPDVVFEIGRPGHSAVQSVVAGTQELVRRGIADPERLGLHGHSWSGYQTAFVVTQTDFFAAAVAGAPVSNMTSAYGGIRYGSGLARQFQYEQTQSRLGASLWEARDRYIESSPLFYADRVETPLLIMFGDEDEAVPWTQGVELYLALRRLDKPSVMLQYRGEGHHPKKYSNKLDYSIKMKEFFDHFLLDAPAPQWWSQGVPFRGDE